MPKELLQIKVQDDGIAKALKQLKKRMQDMTPAFDEIGELIQASVARNFKEGGRPDAWEASARASNDDGTPLSDTGRLKNSLTHKAKKDGVQIGTNVVYAPTHHFGAKAGSFGTVEARVKAHTRRIVRKGKNYGTAQVKAHTRKMSLPWGDIPARPFLMVQDQDRDEILDVIKDYMARAT